MLPISPKDTIRFSPKADAVIRAAEAVAAAALALEEAKAKAEGVKSAETKAAVAATEKALKDAQSAAEAAKEAATAAEPVYLLKVPDIRTRAALRRDVVSDGVVAVTRETYLSAITKAVADGYGSISDDVLAGFAEAFEAGEDLTETQQAAWRNAFLETADSPSVRAVLAESHHSDFLHSYHAARHVLVGIEGGVAFAKVAGIASDATMNAIPPADLKAISDKAMELFYLPQAIAGN